MLYLKTLRQALIKLDKFIRTPKNLLDDGKLGLKENNPKLQP